MFHKSAFYESCIMAGLNGHRIAFIEGGRLILHNIVPLPATVMPLWARTAFSAFVSISLAKPFVQNSLSGRCFRWYSNFINIKKPGAQGRQPAFSGVGTWGITSDALTTFRVGIFDTYIIVTLIVGYGNSSPGAYWLPGYRSGFAGGSLYFSGPYTKAQQVEHAHAL